MISSAHGKTSDALSVAAATVDEFDRSEHVVVVHDEYDFAAACAARSVAFHNIISFNR